MTEQNAPHISVLLEESIRALVTDPDGIYIDATFGRGGHTRALLSKLSPKGRVIALDQLVRYRSLVNATITALSSSRLN